MWLTPKQARLVTGLERYQLDWLRKTGKVQARKWDNMWVYDAGDLYRINDRARRVLDELSAFCEVTDSGRHFTEAFAFWQVLEECGWIEVYRPVHPTTKLRYDIRYYTAELTDEGEEMAKFVDQLRADLTEDEDVLRLHHVSGRVRLARLTTQHSASSYGQPVLADVDTGEAIDGYQLAEYRVEASPEQLAELARNPGYAPYIRVI